LLGDAQSLDSLVVGRSASIRSVAPAISAFAKPDLFTEFSPRVLVIKTVRDGLGIRVTPVEFIGGVVILRREHACSLRAESSKLIEGSVNEESFCPYRGVICIPEEQNSEGLRDRTDGYQHE